MKKFFALSLVIFAFACNSGETTTDSTEELDSAVNSNTEKNINDNPMRTRDTTTNLMKDSLGSVPGTTRDSVNRR